MIGAGHAVAGADIELVKIQVVDDQIFNGAATSLF